MLGNPSTANTSGEWWEVVEKDGTRWRFGWNPNSEQLAAMKGYPGAATGTWEALGYAGRVSNRVVGRWQVDQITDRYGNYMTFSYTEDLQNVDGLSAKYDRAHYLSTINYTHHTSGSPTAGYSVTFILENRGTDDVPATPTAWDNWDTRRLDRIDVKYGSTVVRSYNLGYTIQSYTDAGVTWKITTLTSLAVSGPNPEDPTTTTSAPTVTFTYEDMDNRAVKDSTSNEWAYPRLKTINNGWGGSSTYTYENDGRPYTSWYNWRVKEMTINDGMAGGNPMKSSFAYSTPCYDDASGTSAGWCNTSKIGELIGFGQTTTTNYASNGTTVVGKTVHKYYTDQYNAAMEYETQYQDASNIILGKTVKRYAYVLTCGLPPAEYSYFKYADRVDEYVLSGGSLVMISRTAYSYDADTGNLTREENYYGSDLNAPYRTTISEYVTNTDPSVWILNTLSSRTVQNTNGGVLSEQQYGYDGNLPGVGSPTTPKPILSRVVSGTQTIDTKYRYDSYGNVYETDQYKNYGTTSGQPSGDFASYLTDYDPALKTYAISSDPPLLPATTTEYDYGLGLPITVTDPNNNATTATYDGLGRTTSVTYQGYAQANVKYTYPTPSGSPLAVSAPFALKMEMWDETVSQYRASWQIMDGLGRVIQTQGPYEIAGMLVLTDTSYNAQGLPLYQGLPRTITGTGGGYSAPSWGSVQHTTTSYDALGRTISVAYPDGTSETISYSGLRTTFVDRNNHNRVQENDAFSRLVKVEEYTGSNPYTLYATTQYTYDERDLLKQVMDAAGNLTVINYDGFGRKIDMTDPDLGNWRYRYDPSGNLSAQIDAKRQAVNLYYDDLNRLIGKTYTTGPVNADTYQRPVDPGYTGYSIKNYYDQGTNGYGRRTRLEDPSGYTVWSYNALGQVISGTQNIDGTSYNSSGTYDAFGRPLTQVLPSTEALSYTYNAMGSLVGLSGTSTYVSQIHYNASGQVTDQLLGNGLRQQSCYNASNLRLASLSVYPGALQTCIASPSNSLLSLPIPMRPTVTSAESSMRLAVRL